MYTYYIILCNYIKVVDGIRHRRLGGGDIVVSEVGLGTQRWVRNTPHPYTTLYIHTPTTNITHVLYHAQ